MSVDTGSLVESPWQRLPVWITEPGDLYQLVKVCKVSISVHATLTFCQLWIVVNLPLFSMYLLRDQPAQWGQCLTCALAADIIYQDQPL